MAKDTEVAKDQQNQSPVIALFQKAHGRMVMLQRLDEQLSGLLDQRRKIQEELRGVQSQINDEFNRVMKQADEAPARLLSQIADHSASGDNGSTGSGASRLVEVDEVIA